MDGLASPGNAWMLGFAHAFYGNVRIEALYTNLREDLSPSALRAQKERLDLNHKRNL
jgi:hypothetical protein